MLSAITNITMSNSDAVAYLKRVRLEDNSLSTERMKTILSAAILRYLGGVTSLQFLIDLTQELHNFENITLDKDLVETTTLVSHLGHQVTFENTDQQNIAIALQNVLKKLQN
jgi:hypothetical protein